jgi:hypothetical protein
VAFSPERAERWPPRATTSTVRLWDLSRFGALRDDPVGHACSVTVGGLDADQWTRYVPGIDYGDSCP